MYDLLDLYGFVCNPDYEESIRMKFKQYESIIDALEKENKALKKENYSLGQDNAVLAALVRTTTGIQYTSDYEWEIRLLFLC